MRKICLVFILLEFITLSIWGSDGDIFTAKTADGVDMQFRIISEVEKTCQVGRLVEWATNGNSISLDYDGNITIPSYINDYHVIRIGRCAFDHCNLTSIIIPSDIISIFPDAFNCCYKLESINFDDDGLEKINSSAFNYCTSLKSIIIPRTVNHIGDAAFRACRNLETITVIDGNSKFDSRDNCNAVIETASNELRFGCKNTTIPNSVLSIGEYAFSMFDSSKTLEIPEGVLTIKGQAFENCLELASVVIPSSVTSIGTSAFLNCSTLSFVYSKIGTPFTILNSTFNGISSDAILQVPKGSKDSYLTTSGWSNNFKEIIEEGAETNYVFTVIALGNGSVSYNGQTIKNQTSTFTVNEGTSATVSFSPDNGYRIKSVKVNDSDVTSSVSDNSYTISSISANTTLEVEFEAVTYILSVKVTGNGAIQKEGLNGKYKNSTPNFSVYSGANVKILFFPDDGYRIKIVKVNDTDVTSDVSNSSYTISNISADTGMEVEFEAIPSTYTLSIKAAGHGSASYNGTSIKNSTTNFSVNSGSNATVAFSPDDGYRIKSVKVNDTDVTSSVANNQYTISNISANTTMEVVFEANPVTLTIKATGNGSATYDGTEVRNSTKDFSVSSGTKVTVSFSADSGYRIKTVKVNNTVAASNVSTYQHVISNISANTTLEVEFEVVPKLTIKATGNGSATYNGTAIRENTQDFNVNLGTNATITFSPDSGYRIKSVKVDNSNVTSSVSDNQYTLKNITADVTIEVVFEADNNTPTVPKLTIKATGNGGATYNGTTVKGSTKVFYVDSGTNATVSFNPNNGYRIRSVKVGNSDVTSDVSDNQYTIKNITADVTLEVDFEFNDAPTTYTLTIEATGNGSVSYNGTTVKKASMNFSVNSGANATVSFNPDSGNRISSIKVNNTDVTSQVSGNQYTISNITANTTMEITFEEDVNAITVDGVNYKVISQSDKTVNVVGGNYGQVLTVPASVTSNGKTWTVAGIETDALNGNSELAAVIWEPDATFNAAVSNPNLLLYVKSEAYAPASIQNVVVNGTASNIILKEASSGNNFYCPQAFSAQQISYTHNYQMQTGIGDSRGWETIALPFDVQTITHETNGSIVPFAQWKSGDTTKPFWLYELAGTGFVEASNIQAYTPYIISMPNNPQYDSEWLLNGKVTFAASGVVVGKTENLNQPTFNNRTFVPCFANQGNEADLYALNVNNDFETNNSGVTEGSIFMWKLRSIHPFEAFMTSSSSAPQYAFGVFEGMTTGIQTMVDGRWTKKNVVYDLQGRKVESPSKKGVYIVNGKKKIIK